MAPSGEWLMDYAIYDAQQAGFKDVVIITRTDLLVDMQEHLQKFGEIPYSVSDSATTGGCQPRPTKPWGHRASNFGNERIGENPFVVINADDFFMVEKPTNLYISCFICKAEEPLFSLVGYPLQNTLSDIGSVSRGVCTLDKNNKLISITEMTQIDMHDGKLQNENSDGSFTDIPINSYASMNFGIYLLSV